MEPSNPKPFSEMTEQERTDGFNAYEDEHCAHLAQIGKIAKADGGMVPGAGTLPELNPDGSYVNPEDDRPTNPDGSHVDGKP